jgi:hypothetical protein
VDFEGTARSNYVCHTNQKTLGQLEKYGSCDELKCHAISYPDTPDNWEQKACRDSDIFIQHGFNGWIYYRDLELGDGRPFGIPYNQTNFNARLDTVGDRIKSERNNFGVYSGI